MMKDEKFKGNNMMKERKKVQRIEKLKNKEVVDVKQ